MALDPAAAGLASAGVAALATFVATMRGLRSQDVKELWAENRLQRVERADLEKRLREDIAAAVAAAEARCSAELSAMERRCTAEKDALEVRISALGGA